MTNKVTLILGGYLTLYWYPCHANPNIISKLISEQLPN